MSNLDFPLHVVRVSPDREDTLVCAVMASEQFGRENVVAVMVGDYPNGSAVRAVLGALGVSLYVVSLRKTVDAALIALDNAGYGPSLDGRSRPRGSRSTLAEELGDVLFRQVTDSLSGPRGAQLVTPEQILPSLDRDDVHHRAVALGVNLAAEITAGAL